MESRSPKLVSAPIAFKLLITRFVDMIEATEIVIRTDITNIATRFKSQINVYA